jgi:hypothetical protein
MQFNGHYYQIGSTKATFADSVVLASQRSYRGQFGYLAAVSSQAEYDFVTKTLGARNVWLGATDIAQEDNWLLAAGPSIGTAAPTDLWAYGEPFGGTSENCAMSITGEGLSTANCNETWFYVIEYECQTSSTTDCECKLSWSDLLPVMLIDTLVHVMQYPLATDTGTTFPAHCCRLAMH